MTFINFTLDENVSSLPKFVGGLKTLGVALSIREVHFNLSIRIEGYFTLELVAHIVT